VEEGPATDVFRDPRHPYTAALAGAFPQIGDERFIQAPTGLDGPTKMEIIALITGFVAAYVLGAAAGTTPAEEQVALLAEAVTSGDFPHLAAALSAGGEVREPSFERLAGWTINGLVEQAVLAGSASLRGRSPDLRR